MKTVFTEMLNRHEGLNTQHIINKFQYGFGSLILPCRPMEQLPRFHGGTVTTQMRNLYRWPRAWMGKKQDQPTNPNAVTKNTFVKEVISTVRYILPL